MEDYLENGLDFAGRFALERHADQCVHCNREMTAAKELGRRARALDRVQAPSDFEDKVLHEIAERKIRRRSPFIWRFSPFGLDLPVWQRYAMAASLLVLVGLGIFYWPVSNAIQQPQISSMPTGIPANSFDVETGEDNRAYLSTVPVLSSENTVRTPADVRTDQNRQGFYLRLKTNESDYGEYTAIGPDNLPMIVPLPNTIQMQVGLPSEEFYKTNISH